MVEVVEVLELGENFPIFNLVEEEMIVPQELGVVVVQEGVVFLPELVVVEVHMFLGFQIKKVEQLILLEMEHQEL